MLLVSGGHRPMYDGYDVGHLVCPRSRNAIWSERWAADNAAFSRFDADAYVRMLDAITGTPMCLFVTVPDVVANASKTLGLWDRWAWQVANRGLPTAYVLQDGLTSRMIPWYTADAVFVGGSTAFKLGADARGFIREAQARGKWVHMGRVNTMARLRYAQSIGCDSVDGSGFARFPDAMFSRFTRICAVRNLFASRAGEAVQA
jgi:hypothetical protein